MKLRTATWLSALTLTALLGVTAGAQAPEKAKMDAPVKSFRLRDVMQNQQAHVDLADFKGKKPVVVIFISYNCDVTWRYEGRIGKLLADYAKKDVAFVAVRSSAVDTADGIRRYAEAKNLAMPVLYDEKNVMADYFGVQVTPTFFLIDKDGKLRYSGSYDESMDEAVAKKQYVREALDAVLAGREVAVKSTRPFG